MECNDRLPAKLRPTKQRKMNSSLQESTERRNESNDKKGDGLVGSGSKIHRPFRPKINTKIARLDYHPSFECDEEEKNE